MRSLAAILLLSLAAHAAAADGPTRRFAVVAGASLGGPDRTPLRYATSDARDVSRVLRRLGGVAFDDLVLVEEPDAERLRGALRAVAARAEGSRAAGQRVELFVYYSGHSDERALLLGASRLDYAELRRELDRVPADVRVAILDSCASGAFTRAKGGVHRPPFLLDASSRVSGHAFLTSSAADEAAQESDRLRASFFTHALLTGLRGAADASADGVVTLNEAYQFAFRETLASTEASQGGAQHATYDIGLVGSGDVVMTDLRRADGILVIPEPVDGRVFVRNAAGALVAELRKARGARIELALEEGRYDVRVTREATALGAIVTLAGSDRVVLDEAKLWPIPLEPTASRGDLPGAAPQPTPAPAPAPAPTRRPEGAPLDEFGVSLRAGSVAYQRPGTPFGPQLQLAVEGLAAGIVGFEVSTGYSRAAGTSTGCLPRPLPMQSCGRQVRDEVTVVPGVVTLKLGVPGLRLRPYVLGGVGIYFVRLDRRAANASDQSWQGDPWLSDDGLFALAHAGAGAAIRLSGRLRATVELRYLFGTVTLLQSDLRLESLWLAAGLGYAF